MPCHRCTHRAAALGPGDSRAPTLARGLRVPGNPRAATRRILATIERDGATEQVLARWVVGCDGLHSTTRELSGIELTGHDIAEPWAVFDAPLAGWPDSYEANYAYLDNIPVILTALPERRWRVYLRPSSADSDLVADAMSTMNRYLPTIGFDDIANPTRFHCHTKVARQFRSGRILLTGNAAHICSPAQGHGMNSGLQDAFRRTAHPHFSTAMKRNDAPWRRRSLSRETRSSSRKP